MNPNVTFINDRTKTIAAIPAATVLTLFTFTVGSSFVATTKVPLAIYYAVESDGEFNWSMQHFILIL